MILEIPDEIYQHRYDKEWLEKHGRQALEDYVAMHEPDERTHAYSGFVRDMGLNACWPDWYKKLDEESEAEFEREMSALYPEVNWPWNSKEGESGRGKPGKPASQDPLTAVTTRGAAPGEEGEEGEEGEKEEKDEDE